MVPCQAYSNLEALKHRAGLDHVFKYLYIYTDPTTLNTVVTVLIQQLSVYQTDSGFFNDTGPSCYLFLWNTTKVLPHKKQ